MAPELALLKTGLGEQAEWTMKMGGLIPSWNNFHDEANAVSRPVQMGPVWMHAATVAGKPVRHELWLKDPPATSYTTCIAVKSAQLQSEENGSLMLGMLRNAAMEEGRNIAKPEIIYDIAEKIAGEYPTFDLTRFTIDYNGDRASAAFKEDLQEIQYYKINRFPSILFKSIDGKAILLKGFRTFADFHKELSASFPALRFAD